MISKLLYLSIVIIFCIPNISQAKILFEGYYRLELNQKHIGYIVQRYEFIKKSQIYQSTYLTTMKIAGTENTESLKAQATKDFKPLNYQYTFKEAQRNKDISIKLIDTKFKGVDMTAIVSEGILKKGKPLVKKKLTGKIRKDSILSTFLIHKILATGLKEKSNYPYTAIAEESAGLYVGSAKTIGVEKYKNKNLFKIKNDFNNSIFMSSMDSFGHVFKFNSPVMKLRSRLVKNSSEATNGFKVDTKSLTTLFGSVPSGSSNNLNK